jgi:hypothetical protein
MSLRKSAILTTILLTATASQLAPEFAARAQSANERDVYLVRLDQSDCTNSNVPNENSPAVGGLVMVSRGNDGNTMVKIAMTASPDTAYHFYLKCIRQLGDVKTDDEGVGSAVFTFPTNTTGATYAFDMYPEGAPAGKQVPERDGEVLTVHAPALASGPRYPRARSASTRPAFLLCMAQCATIQARASRWAAAISISDICSETSRRMAIASTRPFCAARLNHLCAATRLTTPERPLAQ